MTSKELQGWLWLILGVICLILISYTKTITYNTYNPKMIEDTRWLVIEKKGLFSEFRTKQIIKKLDKLNNNRDRTFLDTQYYYMIRIYHDDIKKNRWNKYIKIGL